MHSDSMKYFRNDLSNLFQHTFESCRTMYFLLLNLLGMTNVVRFEAKNLKNGQ
jgi:hypothetical protein